MHLLSRLAAPRRARRAAAPPRRPAAELPLHAPDELLPGCGWFDSSHDLQSGLRVTEHAEVGALVNQIPLSWWLGWELDAALSSAR
jgi:hypothetical protein